MIYDINSLGICDLNAMQQDMLQVVRRSDNVVLLSPTGSGKTLAYLLPVIEQMSDVAGSSAPEVLVLVPSRELAIQTMGVAQRLCRDARTVAVYGGRPAMEEHRSLRQVMPRIVVGTPGRVLDHLQKANFAAEGVGTLVIDEFDKSLELGFQQQMSDIMALLPNVKRRILLSATDSELIPRFVGVGADVVRLDYLNGVDDDYVGRICQYVVRSPQKDKLDTLAHVLCECGEERSIVFLNYREAVDRVYDFLRRKGFMATAFHGAMEQKDRERSLFRFQCGSANVLVSTDLAARGLDIDDVQNVIHYHLPLNADTYIHRNGRTARWDKQGRSFIILGPEESVDRFVGDDAHISEIPVPVASEVPSSKWEVLYIGRGKKDKIGKVDVMGFLGKQGGLERGQIGMIRIFPTWCFVAVERKAVKALLRNIEGQKIKGQKTVYSVGAGDIKHSTKQPNNQITK